MDKKHSERFVKITEDAKRRVREIDVASVKKKIESGASFFLVDVREDSEWSESRVPGAVHLSKGVIERDIEKTIPDLDAEIVLYCGGGFRSALAGDNIQKMGYRNVRSMAGGFRAWTDAGFSLERS